MPIWSLLGRAAPSRARKHPMASIAPNRLCNLIPKGISQAIFVKPRDFRVPIDLDLTRVPERSYRANGLKWNWFNTFRLGLLSIQLWLWNLWVVIMSHSGLPLFAPFCLSIWPILEYISVFRCFQGTQCREYDNVLNIPWPKVENNYSEGRRSFVTRPYTEEVERAVTTGLIRFSLCVSAWITGTVITWDSLSYHSIVSSTTMEWYIFHLSSNWTANEPTHRTQRVVLGIEDWVWQCCWTSHQYRL